MNSIPTPPQPFWHRLREITLYPMQGAALIFLVVMTFASLLGNLPGIGWILGIIVWVATYKYAFEILRVSANGRTAAPEVMIEIGDSVVWKFIALQIVLGIVVIAAALIGGPIVGIIMLLLVALMQPGAIISLAIDESFGNAINPATTLAMIQRIGAPYFAAFGLLFVIQASAATAGHWLAPIMPPVVADLVVAFFSTWGLFAAFHLMGYLVYQYHEVLGFEPEEMTRLPRGEAFVNQRDRGLLDQAEALVRDGHPDAALALLRDEVRSRAVSPPTHDLYRRLLLATGDRAAIDDHARLYLHLLMTENKAREGLNLLRDALQANPDFVPMQVEHAEQLATRAHVSGQGQLARDTWLALLRAHPRHENASRWAFDAGMLQAEKFGRDAEARVLLERARQSCDDAALRERIDAALKALPA